MNYLDTGYFGEALPWFGPVLKGYRAHYNSSLMGYPQGNYELAGFLWDEQGHLLSQHVLGCFTSGDTAEIISDIAFPESRDVGGMIGLLLRPLQKYDKPREPAWMTRILSSAGCLTTVIGTNSPGRSNHPERSGRKSSYRMISPELVLNDTWQSLSWHGNASANPLYSNPITLYPSVFAPDGRKLEAAPVRVPAFGSILLDLSSSLGPALRDFLGGSERGSYMVVSRDGGAVGYHLLRHRETGALAMDHSRPTLRYLDIGYGSSDSFTEINTKNAIISSLRYIKWRFIR